MSISLRARYQWRYFIQYLHSFALPTWLLDTRAKLVVLALVVLFGMGYVAQTNRVTTSGYVVHNLEDEVAATNSEIQKLEAEVATYQSMASIQKRLGDAQMVPVSQIKYVKATNDTVVAKR
ncbi:MAG TPA: hypothetical protein VJA27_00575 [Patescibacteria group bacterium]|nr:hypothetical protein [Patescibacteria group bacterium]